MKDAVTYQLSMGNWQTISGALKRAKYDKLFNASASSIILEAIYKINLHNFESYTSIQENGASAHNPVEHDVSAAIGGKDQQLNIVNKTPQQNTRSARW